MGDSAGPSLDRPSRRHIPNSVQQRILVLLTGGGEQVLGIFGYSGVALVEAVQSLLRLSCADVALHGLADGLLHELHKRFTPAGEVGVEVAASEGFWIHEMGAEQAVDELRVDTGLL